MPPKPESVRTCVANTLKARSSRVSRAPKRHAADHAPHGTRTAVERRLLDAVAAEVMVGCGMVGGSGRRSLEPLLER
jgi:hypothetical protein